jgi:hypothetical protein
LSEAIRGLGDDGDCLIVGLRRRTPGGQRPQYSGILPLDVECGQTLMDGDTVVVVWSWDQTVGVATVPKMVTLREELNAKRDEVKSLQVRRIEPIWKHT